MLRLFPATLAVLLTLGCAPKRSETSPEREPPPTPVAKEAPDDSAARPAAPDPRAGPASRPASTPAKPPPRTARPAAGGGSDTDGDGIPDNVDKCPSDPEDRDGYQDADGCPDPDNDGDGIPDVRDKCPNSPEDRDGHQDDDGCPDP